MNNLDYVEWKQMANVHAARNRLRSILSYCTSWLRFCALDWEFCLFHVNKMLHKSSNHFLAWNRFILVDEMKREERETSTGKHMLMDH